MFLPGFPKLKLELKVAFGCAVAVVVDPKGDAVAAGLFKPKPPKPAVLVVEAGDAVLPKPNVVVGCVEVLVLPKRPVPVVPVLGVALNENGLLILILNYF